MSILRAITIACLVALFMLVITTCSEKERVQGGFSGDGVHTPDIPEPGDWLRWSDPATWPDGHKPAEGEEVTIPHGVGILLDETPPPLGVLNISGSLMFEDERDVGLTAKAIMVHEGRLRVGTPGDPFRHIATITLNDTDTSASHHGMGTRGLIVMAGILELHSEDKQATFTKLAANSAPGATTLQVLSSNGFRAGDRIAIAPTDFRSVGGTEVSTIASVSGKTLTLDTPITRPRWGSMQEIGGRNVDERAEVANLTRNIIIQGANDASFNSEGFGAHVMVMRGSVARVHGVEFRRVGQRGRLARYPIHFHLLSYDDQGRALGDATDSYVERIAVSGSGNRCIVLHGTSGVKIRDNVCHDIRGHAIFLEDGVEMRNTIERNLILGVRNPDPGQRLLVNEGPIFQGGSSGFWLTHGDNVVRDNVAADCEGNGFWYSIAERPHGLSKNVPIQPVHMKFGVFEDNVGHSNKLFGLMFDWVTVDDAGNVSPFKYQPFGAGQRGPESDRLDVELERFVAYKNEDSAVWDRVERLRMRDFILADNPGTMFRGAATNCTIEGALVVGTTANSATPMPANRPPNGAASYHSSCDIARNTFVALPVVVGYPSGAFRTDDYYTRAVDLGLVRNADNRFINAHPGYRTPFPTPAEAFALAGALWDPHGLWGAAGNYWVYDTPFLTAGTSCTDVTPIGSNGKSCAGPYYGVGRFYLDDSGDVYKPLVAIEVTREDAGSAVFSIPNGANAPALGWMRHFAMHRGGRYVLRFPGRAPPRSIEISVENLRDGTDTALLAIPFEGDIPARGLATTWANPREAAGFSVTDARARFVRRFTAVSSLNEVAGSDGTRFFQDTANDRIWVLVRGGLPWEGNPDPHSDDNIYRVVYIRFEPAN